MKEITQEQKEALIKPLPDEAVSPHPSKPFLSTIKAIYVTERLNDVFGTGKWQIKTELVEKVEKMVVVKTTLTIPEYDIYYEVFGGNDNTDLGDAYKGATTDGITKIGSYLGIGIDVFKGKQKPTQSNTNTNTQEEKKQVNFSDIDNIQSIEELNRWYKENEPLLKTEKQKEAVIKKCKYRKQQLETK